MGCGVSNRQCRHAPPQQHQPTTTESPSSLFAAADAAPADFAADLTFLVAFALLLVAVRLLALALGLETFFVVFTIVSKFDKELRNLV